MCGIAGSTDLSTNPDIERRVRAVTESLRHRGPDNIGVVAFDGGALGMARLRICSRPDEPVPFRTKYGIAAYNGEVYGQVDRDLRLRDAPEGGPGEVEMLLAHSDQVLPDGMYALALAEQKRGITLKRDVFGIKPLHLLAHSGGYAFASELLPLAQEFGSARVNRQAAAEYLLFGRPVGNATYAGGIQKLPPGATAYLSGNEVRIEHAPMAALWRRRATDTAPPDVGDLVASLESSVAACLNAQRQVGLALSGGVDSTLIAAIAARLGAQSLTTVSVMVAGSTDGLRDLMQLGLPGNAWRSWRHHVTAVGPDDFPELLSRSVGASGAPTRMTSLPLYLALAQTAAEGGTVVLVTGEGADELFLGYRRYPALLDQLENSSDRLGLLMDGLTGGPTMRHWAVRLLGSRRVADCEARFRSHHADIADMTPLDALRNLELKYSLEPLLARTDIALMAESIEGRTPFLHGAMPGLAAAAGPDQLILGRQGKRLIYEAALKVLGPKAKLREKRRFRAPVPAWINGPLSEWAASRMTANVQLLEAAGFEADGVLSLAHRTAARDTTTPSLAYAVLTHIEAAAQLLGQPA